MFVMSGDVSHQRCWAWHDGMMAPIHRYSAAGILLDAFVPWQTGPIPTVEEALAAINAAKGSEGKG